jgi:hypothetical protein
MALEMGQRRSIARDGAEELAEELLEPYAFIDGIGNSTILGIGAGTRDRGLAFRRLGNQSIAEIDTLPLGRSPGVSASCPVHVGVDSRSS